MEPVVSVIVPTRNRPALLERCLSSLRNQSIDSDAYEIIVVDDGPDEETKRLVERAAAEPGPSIQYLATQGARGPAAGRNRGWRNARAPIIAFTDDDTIADDEWLSQGLEAMGPDVMAAAGKVLMALRHDPTDYERNAAGLSDAEFVTANCFCRKALLERVGGFDERFTAAWREDSDLHFTLLEAGLALGQASHARVFHPIRPAPWGVSLRQQSKSRFEALLYKKHPKLYAAKIGHGPVEYYGMVCLLAAAIALQGSAQIFAGCGWAVWTGAFCARRLRFNSLAPAHVAEMVCTSMIIPPLAIFWRLAGAWRYRVWFW